MAAENALELAAQQRQRTVWRMDGGSGSDDNLIWLLKRGYQTVAKGYSNRRAEALSRQVRRWDAYNNYWLGEVAAPVDYGRSVRVVVKKRIKNERSLHSYYVSTLSLPSKGLIMDYYDQRGAAEIEQFRNDKSGLNMTARRKQKFLAQKGYILLTDLAHNLLADFHHQALVGSRIENFGLLRITRDLLRMPGNLIFKDGKLVKIELLSLKHFSHDLLACLERYYLGS